jgi:hypothetical protein
LLFMGVSELMGEKVGADLRQSSPPERAVFGCRCR